MAGKDLKSVRYSKRLTKKIGKRSIYDIINNKVKLSFNEKIAHIRHHHTYYEGNYEMFHDKKGKPNKYKQYLNELIIGVINKQIAPSVLTEFNNEILAWRKEQDLKKEIKAAILLKTTASTIVSKEGFESIDTSYKWQKDIENAQDTAALYIALIKKYIQSKECSLDKDTLKNISYKQLKVLACIWYNETNPKEMEELLDIQQIKHAADIYTRQAKFELKQQKRAEDLMREYAKDLGYITNDN